MEEWYNERHVLFGFMDLNYTVTPFFQRLFFASYFCLVSGLWNVFFIYIGKYGLHVDDLKYAQLVA